MAARVLASTVGLSREDWLALRRQGIGGSDTAVVCGVSKYKSPIELWQEKTGKLPGHEAGEAAYWGTQLEPLIREEFTRQTGIKVITPNQLLQSREHPFMLANLDGCCRNPAGEPCIFEAKTSSAYRSGEWENGSVPQEYIMQVQHYMAVTGYTGAYVAVLIGGNTFQWTYFERDEDIISMLIQTERDFWSRVEDDVPPPADGSDACAKFLSQRYPKSIPLSKIELPATAADLIRQYNEANEQLERLTEQKQKAGNQLKELLGDNETGTIGNDSIVWKTVAQERFDSKLLESEQPELYRQYIRKSSYRRFNVKIAN
jgi:putative phage-type endonuclease